MVSFKPSAFPLYKATDILLVVSYVPQAAHTVIIFNSPVVCNLFHYFLSFLCISDVQLILFTTKFGAKLRAH